MASRHVRQVIRAGVTLLVILAFALPVAAQEPTPTPIVVDGEFVVVQQIDYGQGGVILALLFLSGVLLLNTFYTVSERITAK